MIKFQSLKILYVEDDVNTSEEISYFLKRFTDNLLIAYNGKEGLELFEKHSPQLVLTDIQMPYMNGIDMIKKIKSINPNVFVIVMSAFNDVQYLHQAINLGVSNYLLKPLNLKELSSSIQNYATTINNQVLRHSLDKDQKFTAVNQAWLDFFNYKEEEIIGKVFSEFIQKESIKEFEENYVYLKRHGNLKNVHLLIKHKIGKYIDVALNGEVVYDQNSQLIRTDYELISFSYLMHMKDEIKQLYENEKYLKSLVSTHLQIIKTIVNAFDKEKFLQEVCDSFVENEKYEYSFIALKESDTILKLVSQSKHPAINAIENLGRRFDINSNDDCLVCKATRENKMVIADNLQELGNFPLKEIYIGAGIESIISIPIISKPNTDLMGAITLTFKKKHQFEKEELELFQHISETIAFGLEAIANKKEKEALHKELHIRATTDSLTECSNRYKGKEFLKNELQRSLRYARPLSLIYFDIDDFKKINDNYGHDLGDKVLIEVASSIRNIVRSTDLGVRWGGEEFLVILPESDCQGAVLIAEKLRQAFKKIGIDGFEKVTASFGVVEFNKEESYDALIRRADHLMYQSKMSNKDAIISELDKKRI